MEPQSPSPLDRTTIRAQMSAGPSAQLQLQLLLLLAAGCTHSYKPVVIIHGILDGPEQFHSLSSFITKVGRLRALIWTKSQINLSKMI